MSRRHAWQLQARTRDCCQSPELEAPSSVHTVGFIWCSSFRASQLRRVSGEVDAAVHASMRGRDIQQHTEEVEPLPQPASWQTILFCRRGNDKQHEQLIKKARGLAKKGMPVLLDLQGCTVDAIEPILALQQLLGSPRSVVKLVNGRIYVGWSQLDIHGCCWMENVHITSQHRTLAPDAPVAQPPPVPMLRVTSGSLELLRCIMTQHWSPELSSLPAGALLVHKKGSLRARSCVFNTPDAWIACLGSKACIQDSYFQRPDTRLFPLPITGAAVSGGCSCRVVQLLHAK